MLKSALSPTKLKFYRAKNFEDIFDRWPEHKIIDCCYTCDIEGYLILLR
ncbi:hypothetical protein D1AOALGA4SA_11490 [Olavius algarvensis Delta 1 endosymbiont]|nr:hypothetical protein D1AOALGA4SA_11490 [Olavius algarvensis Delta 1 endosymbiont]